MSDATSALQPLAPFIKLDADERPYLEGFKCSKCAEVLLEHRRGCPKCAALGTLEAFKLSDRGTLFTYTIVHRSFPGIATPFISAIVELEGGGFIKGNLLGVEPNADAVKFNMPIRVEFDRMKAPGNESVEVLRHVFLPLQAGASAERSFS